MPFFRSLRRSIAGGASESPAWPDDRAFVDFTEPQRPDLTYRKIETRKICVTGPMALFLYRCPKTGLNVQGFTAVDPSDGKVVYEMVTCNACPRTHFVNPKTGKVMGSDDK